MNLTAMNKVPTGGLCTGMSIVLPALRFLSFSKVSLGVILAICIFFSNIEVSGVVSSPGGGGSGPTSGEKRLHSSGVAEEESSPPNSGKLSFEIRKSGDLALGIGKLRSYAQRENVAFEMVVKNVGKKKARLSFPSAQEFDFIASDGKEVIWRWSAERMFARVTKERFLAPQESVKFEVVWDQRKKEGTYCDLGNYKVRGILATSRPDSTPWTILGIVD